MRISIAVSATVMLIATAGPAAATPAGDDPGIRQPACTITGGTGDDVLQGTPGDDVICGYSGDDVILGRGGDDTLRGDAGDDILIGGLGRDELYGGAGADRLVDTSDPGTEDGGSGVDLCIGAAGTAFSQCERAYDVG